MPTRPATRDSSGQRHGPRSNATAPNAGGVGSGPTSASRSPAAVSDCTDQLSSTPLPRLVVLQRHHAAAVAVEATAAGAPCRRATGWSAGTSSSGRRPSGPRRRTPRRQRCRPPSSSAHPRRRRWTVTSTCPLGSSSATRQVPARGWRTFTSNERIQGDQRQGQEVEKPCQGASAPCPSPKRHRGNQGAEAPWHVTSNGSGRTRTTPHADPDGWIRNRLHRRGGEGTIRYITFSCVSRLPLFRRDETCAGVRASALRGVRPGRRAADRVGGDA